VYVRGRDFRNFEVFVVLEQVKYKIIFTQKKILDSTVTKYAISNNATRLDMQPRF